MHRYRLHLRHVVTTSAPARRSRRAPANCTATTDNCGDALDCTDYCDDRCINGGSCLTTGACKCLPVTCGVTEEDLRLHPELEPCP